MNFAGIKVKKSWGHELEVFNNGIVSCWYLKLSKDHETSLHMHRHKETAMIILSGSARLQEGLTTGRPIVALDKTRFGAGFFHKHAAINGDCELLEVEYPIDKEDLYRFTDAYGRAGKPYESLENFVELTKNDPQFVSGRMKVGRTTLMTVEFLNSQSFAGWARKLPAENIVVITRGSLRSEHGVEIVKPGQANWSQNLLSLLLNTWPDDRMQAIVIWNDRMGEQNV